MKRTILVLLCLCCFLASRAQEVNNPGEYTALAEGNALINAEVKKNLKAKTATAALQNAIAGEFTMIREWERKYSRYLTDVQGYASQLKAGTQLYHDGVKCFIYLCRLKDALSDNPSGALSTLSMNTLWLETATELLTIYNLLKDAVSKGGDYNMLNGAERSTLLWDLEERLSSFNRKLKLLQRSIRLYSLSDVWNRATAGMIDKDHATIAQQCLEDWHDAAKAALYE